MTPPSRAACRARGWCQQAVLRAPTAAGGGGGWGGPWPVCLLQSAQGRRVSCSALAADGALWASPRPTQRRWRRMPLPSARAFWGQHSPRRPQQPDRAFCTPLIRPWATCGPERRCSRCLSPWKSPYSLNRPSTRPQAASMRCRASSSGGRGRPAAAAASAAAATMLLLLVAAPRPAAARGASFVVEQGNMRVTQPPEIAGAFDSAIGDVRGPPVAPALQSARAPRPPTAGLGRLPHLRALFPLSPPAVWGAALRRHAHRARGVRRRRAAGQRAGVPGLCVAAARAPAAHNPAAGPGG